MDNDPFAKFAPIAPTSTGSAAGTASSSDPFAHLAPVPTASPQQPGGPSFTEGFGTGLMDKAYGLAQVGAHATLDPPPIAYTAEQEKANQVQPEAAKAVDKSLQAREKTLEAEGYNKGWGRMVGGIAGDIALTAPLSIVAPEASGATWLARAAQGARAGALGGAVSGAVTPETSGHFETGKAGQLVRGTVEGGVGGAAFGALAKAIGLGSAEDAEAFIKNAYTKAIRPGGAGKASFKQQDDAYDRARQAMDEIVKRKASLALTDPETGTEVVGKLPSSVAGFSEAIDQTKRSIFSQYSSVAKQTEGAVVDQNTTVPRFQKEFADASRRTTEAEQAARAAQQKALLATAQQSRAGENVYMSSTANTARREAEQQVLAAREALDKASVAKAAALKKMRGVWVDLQPTIRELRAVGKSTLKEVDPATVKYANDLADRLAAKAAYSPLEAQEAIASYNARLTNFYKQPSPNGTGGAAIEAMVANKLREGTDAAITGLTGQNYRAMKNSYGAVRSIEKDVAHRALVQGRNTKGGLGGMLLDLATADQVIHAIGHFDPTALGHAAALRGFKAVREKLLSPDRAVRRMFETAERLQNPQAGTGPAREAISYGVRRIIPQAGAVTGYQSPAHSTLGIQ